MTTFTAKHKPADIVKVFPKASDLFKERRIDFCCGGDKPLKDVFAEQNLDEDAILAELNEAYDEWKQQDHEVIDWDAMPATKLIDHIVQTHHSFLKEELPALEPFVTKVFRVHGTKHPHLKELHKL